MYVTKGLKTPKGLISGALKRPKSAFIGAGKRQKVREILYHEWG